MKKILWPLLALILVLAVWLLQRRSTPPEVRFVKAIRETLVSTLSTNGKVEPLEWTAIRAEREGTISKLYVERGQSIVKGQIILDLDSGDARAALAGAESRITQAQAEGEVVKQGGKTAELAEIESGIASARADRANSQRELDILTRLAQKNAATAAEVQAARTQVQRAQLEIARLEKRRTSLVQPSDRTIAEARLKEAQSSAATASRRIDLSRVRSPMGGVLYQLDAKPGAYLNPGDLIGNVGRLDRLRVIVYVDEPELGRVQQGMPVVITWDALPARQWTGTVERTPSQIITLGTRQVGEVGCVIDNPGLSLVSGTNINAAIRSRVVERALTIPKESLRREDNQSGVYKLQNGQVVWQAIKLGASSITRIEVLEGLTTEDAVALPTEQPLKSGEKVTPVIGATVPASA